MDESFSAYDRGHVIGRRIRVTILQRSMATKVLFNSCISYLDRSFIFNSNPVKQQFLKSTG